MRLRRAHALRVPCRRAHRASAAQHARRGGGMLPPEPRPSRRPPRAAAPGSAPRAASWGGGHGQIAGRGGSMAGRRWPLPAPGDNLRTGRSRTAGPLSRTADPHARRPHVVINPWAGPLLERRAWPGIEGSPSPPQPQPPACGTPITARRVYFLLFVRMLPGAILGPLISAPWKHARLHAPTARRRLHAGDRTPATARAA